MHQGLGSTRREVAHPPCPIQEPRRGANPTWRSEPGTDTQILGDGGKKRIETRIPGRLRFSSHQQHQRMTVVLNATEELEHQPQPASFVLLGLADPIRKVAEPEQTRVGLDSQSHDVSGRPDHAREHRPGGLARSRFVGRYRGLARACQLRQLRLREPGPPSGLPQRFTCVRLKAIFTHIGS